MINTDIDWGFVHKEFQQHNVAIVDNFIDLKTINFLRDFAQKTQHRDTYYEGYSALEFNRNSPLPYLMEELVKDSEKLVPLFKEKKFSRGWFFIYDYVSGGVGVHIDPLSDITMNLWVTPEDCVDAGSGFNGLDIWKIYPKPGWGYETSLYDHQACLDYINEVQPELVSIEYKFNRAVFFNSSYFHRSQPVKFKEGLENRKINYAFLFNEDGM